MPSNYKRKTTQQNWDAEAMKKAIEAVQKGEMNFSKAATVYNIPRSTLKRRVKNKNVKATDNKKLLGCCAVFTEEQEMELVNVIFEMEEKFGKLSFLDVRSLAYQLAEKKQLRHTFSQAKRIAGKDWLRGFRKRHPEVVLRNPEIPWLEKGRAIKAAKRAMIAAQNPLSCPDAEKKKMKKKVENDNVDTKPSVVIKSEENYLIIDNAQVTEINSESEIKVECFPEDGISESPLVTSSAIAGKSETDDLYQTQGSPSELPRVTNSADFSDSEISVAYQTQGSASELLPRVTNSADCSESEINVLDQSHGRISELPRVTSNVEFSSVEPKTINTTSNSIIIDILNAPSLEPSPEMDLDIISPQTTSEMTIEQKPMFGIRGGIMKKKLYCKRE